QELGLSDKASGDHLLTAVTSFGKGFLNHTPKPTSNRKQIQKAIDSIPNDPSGKEMLCQAVGLAIRQYRTYARGGRYQLVLIVVTDESGDPESNNRYLELAISEAKSVNCKTYVLGREAVFGYPYAHMRWRHPQTNRIHWLRIDRGPETAFVEQLQTNGFRRRYDSFSSGFGPYEQTRLARETSGVFFMLPSVETNLVRGNVDKRRYQLEALRPYLPDMRSRLEQIQERDEVPMRSLIWQVIYELSPYNSKSAKVIEMRMTFSLSPPEFVKQVRIEQAKAKLYLQYLQRAENAMEEAASLREKETSPRWQANYDLIYAQIIAYQARIYEYAAFLEMFVRKPKVVPLAKGPNTKLVHWDIRTRKELVAASVSQPYIDKATSMFQQVIQDNPGTPWAERARVELARGFGIDLVPDYDSTIRRPRISGPLQLIPKL
ncbi:MAG TPA: VWA domain-containing protein, partial [Planctomycetaceae bacterium]|nr:VWA domain-containing protein [Planctomycetaceae bacterium]